MLTITEALAEIKMLQKRVEKKREFVTTFLVRQERFKDPLAKEGGSYQAIERERQAINDLEDRIILLRLAIAAVNSTTVVAVNGSSKTIADWLAWKREVAPNLGQFLRRLRQHIDAARQEAAKKGVNVISGDVTAGTDTDVIINLSEHKLAEEAESLEEILGTLDGQLSLKNATTTIDV